MIDILFFGRMADLMRERRLSLDLTDARGTLFRLREDIFQELVDSGQVTPGLIRMSVNKVVTRSDQPLSDGDEVAFFSVFSGG
ncbi:MoaD/ThiS family protein [Asticcacaulis taihuensis]|uniref:MoaD/ThiS family protein n=1 Tax=Asticcacaulis taihuensis TaxID=260084 RepID=UPI003F7C5D1D